MKPRIIRSKKGGDASASTAFSEAVKGTETFAYDAIGNLTTHTKPSGLTQLAWNAYGKVRQVTTGSATMTFGYDAQQNRLSKTVTANGVTKTSYYIRDAQGNALAVYERKGSSLIWKEQDLYGSSRLGMAKPEREMTGFFWQSASYTLVAGAKSYEFSNHLGNVLAVISDRGELQSAQDYFPFGMAMPGRSSGAYRYGFNGKETDPETGIQDYGMRWYLPNIARFPSVDPLIKKFPMLTPYQFAGNTPIQAVDLDGGEPRYYITQRDVARLVNDAVRGTTCLATLQIQMIGAKVEAALKKLMGNQVDNAYITSEQYLTGKAKNFPQNFANYDKDEDRGQWGVCWYDCMDDNSTEVDALTGYGAISVDIYTVQTRTIALAPNQISLSLNASNNFKLNKDELSKYSLDLAMQAMTKIEKKLDDSEKKALIAFAKANIEAAIEISVKNNQSVSQTQSSQGTLSINVSMPGTVILSDIKMKVQQYRMSHIDKNGEGGKMIDAESNTFSIGHAVQVVEGEINLQKSAPRK